MVYLYGHEGSGNHGCEAIVRTTVKTIGDKVTLLSSHVDQDLKYGLNKVCEVAEDVNDDISRGSLEWFLSRTQTKINGTIDLAIRFRKKTLLRLVVKQDVFLSIGGDTYCYEGTDVKAAINTNLRKKGAKLVLWGCSVEPELIKKDYIAKDLSQYKLITARESISYEALRTINPNTKFVPDSAFALERIDLPLPDMWKDNMMIGINASPLILQSAKDGNLIYEAYRKLITEILQNTDYNIVLIPHVVWDNNDDRIPLKHLYEDFENSERIILLEDCNCMELKGYIARCRMFIGARTHATIAAYSTCVPTLVLGYSVKSRGIAKDLFGSYENYVIPVQNVSNDDVLVEGFKWLEKNEAKIREHLVNIMPQYIERISSAKDLLFNL